MFAVFLLANIISRFFKVNKLLYRQMRTIRDFSHKKCENWFFWFGSHLKIFRLTTLWKYGLHWSGLSKCYNNILYYTIETILRFPLSPLHNWREIKCNWWSDLYSHIHFVSNVFKYLHLILLALVWKKN